MPERPDILGGTEAGEGAWRDQREWLSVILSSIGDGVITTDSHGDIISLNPMAQSLTGWTSAEAEGVPLEVVFKIINEMSRETVESPGLRALREGVVNILADHSLLISKDGKEWPIDENAAPIRDATGIIAGVILVFREISERRRGEKVLADALKFAEEIIATLREPVVVLDEDLRVKTANAAFYRAFHVSNDATEGRDLDKLGDGQWDIPLLRTLLKALKADASVDNFEVEHDFPAIGVRRMLLNARRFPIGGDHREYILLAIKDVTDRMQAEAIIKASELRYRRLFQTAKDGILILDANSGKILDANPFMSGLLGYETTDFLGKELWEIGLFRDQEENRAAYRELQQKGYIRYDHLPLKTKGGRRVDVEFVSNVYQAGPSQIVQCNIRDITDRIRLEEQAKEQAKSLADLHRRKDEFLAMLSHELRNPLSPILNAVHLLRLQGSVNLIQQEARNVIERQVGQLARLVDDLMEVSRITTGRVRLDPHRLDARTVVERALESARPLIERHQHELIVSIPIGPIWLNADSTRLEQVVVNLLNNAAKYTEDGGRIWVTLGQEGSQMVLKVKDTGIGIAPEMIPYIFDLFTQADRSLDRSQGGLGIGLSLVQHLVGLHRGTVNVLSEGLGCGCEFIVRLPRQLSQPIEEPVEPAKPAVEDPHGRQILVVDDNEDSAEMLAKLLTRSGHVVRTAYSGTAALDVAAEQLPELVLLDIGLPGINGYEVARRLRLLPQLGGVKLIAMTGYGQDSDRQLAQEAGFDTHLTKPIDFSKILGLLTALFSSSE